MRMAQCRIASSGAFTRAGAGFPPMSVNRRSAGILAGWSGGLKCADSCHSRERPSPWAQAKIVIRLRDTQIRSRYDRAPQRVSPRSDSVLADPQQVIADLRRANADLQRTLNERTAERDEAFSQQTATAEVLQVINSSPGDLQPVFDAMLENIIRLCEAAHGHLLTYDGDLFHPAAVYGATHFAEYWRQQGAFRPSNENPLERLLQGERFVHVADAREDDAYHDIPVYREVIDRGTVRTSLTVPLRKDGELLGAVRAYRQEVRLFTDTQIALVENFAAQAVIAMENARLITETREALDQQTATAEVLGVINSSPGDLAPVFDAMLEKAVRLCGADQGTLRTFDGEVFPLAAINGHDLDAIERVKQLGRAVVIIDEPSIEISLQKGGGGEPPP